MPVLTTLPELETTLPELEKQFRRFDRRCAVTSGMPGYSRNHTSRRRTLLAIREHRELTPWEQMLAGAITTQQYLDRMKSGTPSPSAS